MAASVACSPTMPSVPIPPPPELVVCDLAGTTVYDRGEVPAAFADALREAAVPFDPAEIAAWRGASKWEVLGRLLGRDGASAEAVAQRLPRVYGRFHALLAERLARAAPVSLPGVGEAFARLRAGGIRIALTTGFDRALVEQLLAAVDWAGLVDAWVCSDDVGRGRPAPDMILLALRRCGVPDGDRVAVVGDTRLDLEAARNAGAPWRIGVLTGAHDRATLAAAPYTHLLDSVRDVPSLWLRE
jgi:phosphonatase-like hydrolase